MLFELLYGRVSLYFQQAIITAVNEVWPKVWKIELGSILKFDYRSEVHKIWWSRGRLDRV